MLNLPLLKKLTRPSGLFTCVIFFIYGIMFSMEKSKTIVKRKNINTGAVALKHKMVIKSMQEKLRKGEKVTLASAMKENGYSDSYSDSGQLKKKKTWQQLMAEYLPDELLAETHNQLLKSKEIRQLNFNYKLKDSEIEKIISDQGWTFIGTKRFMTTATVFFSAPNDMIRHKASELGYKIKGKMAPDELKIEDNRLQSMTTEEIETLIAKKKAFFNKED